MATLASIKKQIADLQKKAEALVKAESRDVIAKVKSLIDKYQLTAEDLGFAAGRAAATTGSVSKAAKPAKAKRGAGARKKTAAKSVGVAMYQDPKSGKTWTGRGKPPNWLAGVKDRSAFLIGAAEAAPAPAAPAEAPRKKAGRVKKAKAAAPVKAAAPAKAARKSNGANGAKPAKAKRAAKPVAEKPAAKRAGKGKAAQAAAPADSGQAASAAAA